MAYVSVDVDVDLSEIYDNLSNYEKQEILEWLDGDGFTTEPTDTPKKGGITNQEFNKVCDKLKESYYRMTKEDEETIIKIMKKYEFF